MRHCFVVRVFTIGEAGGNALGVIPDSTGLGDGDMQRIAADLGFSETVFIDWPPGEVPDLRIFTPAVEMPFAGHPLVGTGWVLNEMGPGTDRMRIRIGEVGVRRDDSLVWVAVPEADRVVEEVDPAPVGRAVGIGGARVWRVTVPSEYLLIELGSEADLDAFDLDPAAVADVTEGLYLFTGGEPVRARFFAPRLGVDEDPATGSAAVAYSAVQESLGHGAGHVRIVQGRPGALSQIHLTWDHGRVELGGAVVRDEVRLLDD